MFLIIHKETMAMLRTVSSDRPSKTYFDTERSAKGWLTKMINNGKVTRWDRDRREYVSFDKKDFIIMDVEEYSKVEPMIERTSFMDPTITFMESINTPNHCSPSSESYWSM